MENTPIYRSDPNTLFLVPALLGAGFTCIAVFGVTTGDWMQYFAMVVSPIFFLIAFRVWGTTVAVYPDRIEHEHRWIKPKITRFDDLVEASFVETPLSHPKMRLRTKSGKVLRRSINGKRGDGETGLFVSSIHDALVAGDYPVDSRNLEGKSPFVGWAYKTD